jgi:hypothetical protein
MVPLCRSHLRGRPVRAGNAPSTNPPMIRGSLALAGVAVLVVTTSLRHAPPPVIGVLEQPPQCSETRSIGV